MVDSSQDDELLHLASLRHSVSPDLMAELMALAPNFENLSAYGAKVNFSRSVSSILDAAAAREGSGTK
ncbi:hypothetical protein DFO50_11159 [Microvirgula sp. AG722]|uniref:hypothetical protein n=1 Tax=Microvirgula sp. AG722 TaxID=2183901 RepID=UPI000DC41ED9|nr:hypothetical protein [Microvirgula sp. AG722]RAS14244.1 hypothetical protein DFO50_11159 [Microvirgula sp. AG722]